MAWGTWLRGAGLAAVLAALLWAAAAQAQERPVLALVEAGSERLVVGWTWDGGDDPAAFSVHWRRRVSGAAWESAQADGAARRFEITGLRPDSTYIVRVRALDAEGRGIRAPGGARPFDLRGVFDTIQLPVPDPPRVVFDGERATASWDAVEGATGYELAWGLTGETAATERLGADTLEFATGALAAGSRYEFRLRSLHQRDRSAPSAAATLTTAAWPHPAPRARFEFHRAAGMLVEWDAVTGVNDYVVAWQKEGDDSRAGETAATGTSALVTREGGFFTGSWLLRVRAAKAGTWSQTTRVWVDSPAPELRFSLESSRDLCTEGTLTEIRWRGGGGGGNLWPHVNGRMIGENTYRIKVNCGLIPRTADGKIDETQRDAVITGFLRDGRGTIKSASIRVPRAPTPPPPSNIEIWRSSTELDFAWQKNSSDTYSDQSLHHVLRWRPVEETAWKYENRSSFGDPFVVYGEITDLQIDTAYEFQIAAVRDPADLETPSALDWSAITTTRTRSTPKGVTARATHDTVSVQWQSQAGVLHYVITIELTSGTPSEMSDSIIMSQSFDPRDRQEAVHTVEFSQLMPDRSYQLTVGTIDDPYDQLVSSVLIRTNPAPLGWTAPMRQVQNLRATSTRDSITATWDPPYPDPDGGYLLSLFHPVYSVPRYERTIDGETTFTFTHLKPGLTYTVVVEHLAVHTEERRIKISTKPPADAGGAEDAESSIAPPTEWPFPAPIFAWPYFFSTRLQLSEDMWAGRDNKFHAGLDIAGGNLGGGRTGIDPILASAPGTVRVFDLRKKPRRFAVYCPTLPTETGSLSEKIRISNDPWRYISKDTTYACGYLVAPAHGVTALVFHRAIDGRHFLTKYAHFNEDPSAYPISVPDWDIERFDDDRVSNPPSISRGAVLGLEGNTGDSRGPHLHFEIRHFDGSSRDVSKYWFTTNREFTRGCVLLGTRTDPKNQPFKRCAWPVKENNGALISIEPDPRSMTTFLDPELMLSPPPASDVPTSATGQIVDNTVPLFQLEQVAARQTDNRTLADINLTTSFWRPSFYDTKEKWKDPASAPGGPSRPEIPGIGGTRPGVSEYAARVNCSPEASRSRLDIAAGGEHGEVLPVTVTVPLSLGAECSVVVRTGNFVWPTSRAIAPEMYGPPIDFTPASELHPTGKLANYGVSFASNGITSTTNRLLNNNHFHLYEVRAQANHKYEFSVEPEVPTALNSIVLKLWKDGNDASGGDREDESKIENWMTSVTGTIFLSIEGAVQSGNQRWSGIYDFSYSEVAPLAVNATANPVTCLPDGKTTISWTVTGGTGDVTVTIKDANSIDPAFSEKTFITRSGSAEVKCQRAEGRQTVLVSVKDSEKNEDSAPPIGVAVHRPICALPSGGVSGQAATDGSTPDSATCKPPAPTLASSSTATSSSITASWSAATGATLHKVQIGETPSTGTATYGSEQTPSGSGGTSHTFTGLTANKNYSIRVTAYNGAITGGSDEASGFWTKPAAPANLRVSSRQPTSLTITWTAVSGLTYKVQRSGRTTWSTPSGTGTHKFTGLTAGTTYTLKVRAENTAGASTPSSTKPTTPSVLSATLSPTSASCQTGNTVRLTWTATGGTAPYTSTPSSNPYTYRCSSTGTKTVTFTIKDSGTPKQSVTKQARITVTSPPAPPPTPPYEPEDDLVLTASADKSACETGGTVKVTWSTEGGSGTIRVTVDGTSVTTSPTTVTCKSEAGTQEIRVVATDGAANSDTERISLTVVPPLTVRPGSSTINCTTGTQAEISWSVSGGTSPYTVTVDGASTSGSKKTVQCPATVSTKTIRIVATDSTSAPKLRKSAEVALKATCTISAPSGLSASPVANSAHHTIALSWTAVSGLSYRVRKSSTDATGVSASGSSHRFTGLSSDTEYDFSVQAVKGTCKSSWAASESARTHAAVRIVIRQHENDKFEVGMRLGGSTEELLPRLRSFTAQDIEESVTRALRSSEVIDTEKKRNYGKVRVSFSSRHLGDILVQAVTPAGEIKSPNLNRFDVIEMKGTGWKRSSIIYYASAVAGSSTTGAQSADGMMDAAPADHVDAPFVDGGLLEADEEPSE